MSSTRGIPTKYRGTQFRSRLEARWAVLFDLLGWRWEYEPFDLDGYIPDFLIMGDEQLVVEVKPVSTFKAASIVGQSLPATEDDLVVVGLTPSLICPEAWTAGSATAGALNQIWNENGKREVWAFAPGIWARCEKCQLPGIYHQEGSFVLHPCGHYEGDHFLGPLGGWEIEEFWADARNDTQWMAAS